MVPRRSSLAMLLCSGLLAQGCVSAQVFQRHEAATARTVTELPAVPLAVNELAFPRQRTQVIGPEEPRGEQVGDVRLAALDEQIFGLWRGADPSAIRSSSLGVNGLEMPGFVLQVTLRSYVSGSSIDPGGAAAGVIVLVLTGGIAGSVLCAATRRIQHRFQADVRLYRSSEADLVAMPSPVSGERVSQYDTSGATALFRQTYDLDVESGYSQCAEPTGADRHRLTQEEGREMAWRIFEASRDGVADAIARARSAARVRAVAPVAPDREPWWASSPSDRSGNATPEEVVRARLDAAASRILTCTGTESAAIRATWDAQGRVVIGLRDTEDSAVLGCVRAAVGSLSVDAHGSIGAVLHGVAR